MTATNAPKKVMLLQGPVGPFFKELHDAFLSIGFEVQQVTFNSGDRLFSRADRCKNFSGGTDEWKTWLRFEFAQFAPDLVILFGSSRPAHKMARELAGEYGIGVISLEEGYLRTGYITCEQGGNNQFSPIAAKTDFADLKSEAAAAGKYPSPGLFPQFCKAVWSAAYYLYRDAFSSSKETHLMHREREGCVSLSLRWARHLVERSIARLREVFTIGRLQKKGDFILVPLQVSTDSQIVEAARGWTTINLIDACLTAIAATGFKQRVVFKLHPLERQSSSISKEIRKRARLYGDNRPPIKVISSGRIGRLTQSCTGMVVINSTSAFSALHHHVPVLVLGESVYRHDEVVTVGHTAEDIVRFFRFRQSKDRVKIDGFLETLKAQSLIPGDFYAFGARSRAIGGIVEMVQGSVAAVTDKQGLRG